MNATVENETTARRKLFYQKLYWFDFFGDTMHLNGFEKGIYLVLIGNYFMNRGPLPDDDNRLALMTSLTLEQWQAVRPALERRFEVREGLWRHQATERAVTEAATEYEARKRGGRLTRAKIRDQRLAQIAAQYRAEHPAEEPAKPPAHQPAEHPADSPTEHPAEHPAQLTQLQLQSEAEAEPPPPPPTPFDGPPPGFGPVTPAEEEEVMRRVWELLGDRRMYQRNVAAWRLLLYDHPAAYREALTMAECRKKEALLGLCEPQSWSMYLSQTFKHIKKRYERTAAVDSPPPPPPDETHEP